MYPVEPEFTNPNSSFHLHKSVTDLLHPLMTTYGNGEVFSKLIYEGINKDYERRTAEYFSYHATCRREMLQTAREQDGTTSPVLPDCPNYPSNPNEFLPKR